MSKLDDFNSINYFEKINEDHNFSCSEEIHNFCHYHTCYWIVDLINAYTNSNAFLEYSWLVRWELTVKDLKGWLVADDGKGNVIMRRRLTYVDMEDIQLCFLKRGEFLTFCDYERE